MLCSTGIVQHIFNAIIKTYTLKDSLRHKGLRTRLAVELQEKGIKCEKTLNAIRLVPRHLFLPSEFETHAYEDKAFPIGEGQTISQPYTVAYQTQLLQPEPGKKILEIGTGSGYQAAILCATGVEVFSIERIASLQTNALKILKEIGYSITAKIDDGTEGWKQHAPYDGIVVTAGAPSVPKAYIDQLKVGGVLIIPVGKTNEVQKMVKITKTSAETFDTKVLDGFRFVPLLGKYGWQE